MVVINDKIDCLPHTLSVIKYVFYSFPKKIYTYILETNTNVGLHFFPFCVFIMTKKKYMYNKTKNNNHMAETKCPLSIVYKLLSGIHGLTYNIIVTITQKEKDVGRK